MFSLVTITALDLHNIAIPKGIFGWRNLGIIELRGIISYLLFSYKSCTEK